jgi:plastocyanin
MESTNPNQNQPVQVIAPQPARPHKRRFAKWLTLAALIFVVGGASVLWLVRDNATEVEAAPAATVQITPTGFVPQTIKVKKGEVVTWVNADTKPHQVASDPHPSDDGLDTLNSDEPLAEGESYTATFEESGTFTYHDEADPIGFTATVVVE